MNKLQKKQYKELKRQITEGKLPIDSVIGCASVGVFDKNKNEIKEGNVIKHNDNLFIIKFSKNQKQWVGRASDGMNWREYDWLKRVGKYCEVIADIHSDAWVWERWQHCL